MFHHQSFGREWLKGGQQWSFQMFRSFKPIYITQVAGSLPNLFKSRQRETGGDEEGEGVREMEAQKWGRQMIVNAKDGQGGEGSENDVKVKGIHGSLKCFENYMET